MYSKKETVKVLLYDLKPHPKNPKKHNDALIEKSISELGYAENIVVDENNIILAGHGRVDALKKTTGVDGGGMEVEAIRITGWTEEEKEKYLLLSNQSTILGGFDSLLLKDFDGLILDYVGLDSDILIEPDEKDDEIPEGVPPQAKLGDLYQLGNHRVLCGDSTKESDVERLMGGVFADMVFTDPPYNVDYSGEGENTSNKILNDKMSDDSFDTFLGEVFKRYNDHTKSGAGWYVFHSSSIQHQFQKAIENAGWQVKNQIIWNKPTVSMGWGDYRWKHEPMFYCGKEKTVFYGDRANTTILDFHKSEQQLINWAKRVKRDEQNGKTTIWTMKRESVTGYKHPTQKPVELIGYALHNSSKADDIVLDLFGGSGATLIACEKLSRKCYMMELDPKYVDVIITRWEEYTGQKAEKLV